MGVTRAGEGGRIRGVGLLVRGAVAGVIALASMIPGWVSPVEAKWVPRTLGRAVAQSSPGTIHFDFAPTDVAASWVGPSDSEIEYRVTAADGSVSQWDHLHASPDMAKGRRQFSTIVGVDRPQSLEWRVAPGSASVRAVKFFYVNTEDGPLQRIEVPRVAEAAATTPNVVTRAEWGADESLKHISGDCKRDFAPLQQIFVHHTAAEPKGQDYDAAMRAIYWYHVKGRGWCDIGYNFVVAPNGRLFEGRWARDYAPFELHSSENLDGEAVVGAQVEGFNTGSIGVSLMGNYMNHSMTTAMRSSLVDFLAWEADRHNLDPTGSHVYRNPETGVHAWLPYIAGHRDAGKTSCPGDYVYRSLSALRKSVAQVIAAGKRATKLTLSGSTGTVPVGQPVTFKGRLVDEKGAALAGRQVKLYRRAGGQWSLVRKVTTGGAGGFSATFEPRRRFTLRAYYPGGVHLWSSVSHDFRVVVSHFVTLKLDGGRDDGTGKLLYPADTKSIHMHGSFAPLQDAVLKLRIFRVHADGTKTRIAKVGVPAKPDRTYSYDYAVPGAGTYEAVTWYPKDSEHLGGHSDPVRFEIEAAP